MSVRATVTFTAPWWVVCQDFLAGIGAVATATAVGVAAHIPIHMPDIVSVFFIEDIVRDQAEALTPEYEAFLQSKAYALKEQSILEASKMFQMTIFAEIVV